MTTSLAGSSARRYAILGTGALGGFYGARLQQAGLEVHYLLHRDYEYVRQHGLVIESVDGDFTLPIVHAYQDIQQMPPCDVVIVALKTTQNYLLPDLLPNSLKPNGVVLVLQNGLGVEPIVAEIMGNDRVMGGLSFLCSNKIGPGHIKHLDYSAIKLGEYGSGYSPQGITPRMKEIAKDFQRAKVPIELCPDLFLVRWQKLMWNIPFNGLSVVLDARTDELMGEAQTRLLVEQLMREVIEGAKACDRYISPDVIQEMLDHTEKMTPYKTSMKLDYDQRRPMEVETIFANPLKVAKQAGATLPQISMLFQQLMFLNHRNLKQESPHGNL